MNSDADCQMSAVLCFNAKRLGQREPVCDLVTVLSSDFLTKQMFSHAGRTAVLNNSVTSEMTRRLLLGKVLMETTSATSVSSCAWDWSRWQENQWKVQDH